MIKINSIQQEEEKERLCPRCLANEVNNWINEKWAEIDEETKKQIREELKTIKLISGKCIVCNNNLIADNTSERILKILEENNTSNELKKEFSRFFCFSLI